MNVKKMFFNNKAKNYQFLTKNFSIIYTFLFCWYILFYIVSIIYNII